MTETFYLWDAEGRPSGSILCDPTGPLPERCTPVPPPTPTSIWRGAWVEAPQVDLDALKATLSARATAMRKTLESGGIDFHGVRIATAVEDQNRITGAIMGLTLTGGASVDFHAESGWVTLTLAELQAIASAITTYAQRCFTCQRMHHEAIASLTSPEAAAAYDLGSGWPT